MQRIRIATIVHGTLQRVAHFQDSARRIVEAVGQWIVSPLSHFMRQRRYILRKIAGEIDVVKHRVGLRIGGISERVVVASDAAPPTLCEVHVVYDSDGKCIGLNLAEAANDSLQLPVKI